MSNLRVLFFTCVLLTQGAAALLAQQPATPDSIRWVRVYTQSPKHKNLEGWLVAENDSFLFVRLRHFDSLSIPKNTIRRVQYIKPYFSDGHAHRYFAGTSGHGLRKGEIAYDNGMLFFNQLSYGLNDRITIGAGTSFGFVFGGPWGHWIAPKVSLPLKKDQITLTLGGIIGQSISSYEPDNYSFNATYGQLTFGSREAHISIGGGLVTSRGQWRRPVLSVASALRVARGVAFLLEGYMFEDYGERITLIGPGIRLMGRRAALDIAIVRYKDDYYGQIVPWGSLHLLFGKIKQ